MESSGGEDSGIGWFREWRRRKGDVLSNVGEMVRDRVVSSSIYGIRIVREIKVDF